MAKKGSGTPAKDAATNETAAALAAASPVKVRVLVDCPVGKCNTVVTVDTADLAGLDGFVDASPEAVAYAESLEQ